ANGEPTGIGRSTDKGVQVADAVSEVVAVAWDSTCRLFAVQNEYLTTVRARQPRRRGQSRRPCTNDGDLSLDLESLGSNGHTTASFGGIAHAVEGGDCWWPSISALISAPQKNPWHRPFIARVRRRNPPSPAGGISEE